MRTTRTTFLSSTWLHASFCWAKSSNHLLEDPGPLLRLERNVEINIHDAFEALFFGEDAISESKYVVAV